jgi:hypothetical protein
MRRSADNTLIARVRLPGTSALRRCALAVFMAAAIPASDAVAQESGVELQFETTILELGESIGGQLVCTNTGEPQAPRYTAVPGLELQLVRATPSQSSFTSIVNGRMTQRTSFTFPMRLTGVREGTYTLGPVTVEADGATYQTETVTITVRDTQDSSRDDGDRLAFVRVSAEPTSVYVTESIQASITIGIRKVYLNGRKVDYDVRKIDTSGSDLSVFGDRFDVSEAALSDSRGVRHEYLVYRQTQDLRAENVGEVQVGPVFLKLKYPTEFRRGFFSRLEPSRTKRVIARSDAVSVEVKGPPAEGRPDDFTGAIGRYTMRAGIKPNRIEHGRPVTLTIGIQGRPIEGIAGPDLTKQAELASRFDYAGDELAGDVERDGLKVFRRAIFAKQQGEQTVPPISWSYFDPRSERYVTLTTEPLPLTVDPPAAGTASTLPFEDDMANGEAGLTLLHGGISPNYVDPGEVLVSQSFVFTGPAAATTLALPPLLYCIAAVAARHRRKVRGDVSFARRRKALRVGRRLVAEAMRPEDRGRQLEDLAKALTVYLAHRFDLPPGELTPQEVRELLVSNGQDQATAGEVADFLGTCDALRYAPGAAGRTTPTEMAAKVGGWMKQIERGA